MSPTKAVIHNRSGCFRDRGSTKSDGMMMEDADVDADADADADTSKRLVPKDRIAGWL